MFVFKYLIIKIQNDNIVTIPAAERHLRCGKPEGSAFRAWLQRPNDTTPETERASSMSIAEDTAPGVVGASKNPVNSRGGYFPREDFPWWPVAVQKTP